MSEEKKGRNEHPWWVDAAKYFVDRFGNGIIFSLLRALPADAQGWIRKTFSGPKGEAMLAGGSIGIPRMIKDTPLGELAEEAIREFFSAVKIFVDENPGVEMSESGNLPSSLKEKFSVAEAAIRLGMGDLSDEQSENVAAFVTAIKIAFGPEKAQQAIFMLDKMSFKDLVRFSKLASDDMVSEFEARTWRPEPKPAPSKGPSWIQRQRQSLEDINRRLDEEIASLRPVQAGDVIHCPRNEAGEALAMAKVTAKQKLSKLSEAWTNFSPPFLWVIKRKKKGDGNGSSEPDSGEPQGGMPEGEDGGGSNESAAAPFTVPLGAVDKVLRELEDEGALGDLVFASSWHRFSAVPEMECAEALIDSLVHPENLRELRALAAKTLAKSTPAGNGKSNQADEVICGDEDIVSVEDIGGENGFAGEDFSEGEEPILLTQRKETVSEPEEKYLSEDEHQRILDMLMS